MRILLETLVQVLNVLAIATKYCNRAAERHSWLRHAKDTVSLRTSKSCICSIAEILLIMYRKRITSVL